MNVSARVKASREAPSATTAMGPSSVGPAGATRDVSGDTVNVAQMR